jgi:ferredoxin-NADP reductase
MRPLILLVDKWLNKITMYRLLLYGLGILLIIAAGFSFAGTLSYTGQAVLATTAVLVAVCYAVNWAMAAAYQAPTNTESYLITALIMACILPPTTNSTKLFYIALGGAAAVVSKFALALHHKHIFNPAVAGAVILSLTGLLSVTWWIGNPTMLPFTLLLGLLIVRKIRRFKLLITFILAATAMTIFVAVVNDQSIMVYVKNMVLSGPLIFLGTIMLTEPATMPYEDYYMLLYGFLVGILFSARLRYGILSTSPHLVLAVGNIFAFIVNPHYKVRIKLKEIIQQSPKVFDYVFVPARQIAFTPGQYMEWTLPHKRVDGRGNRRTFTIASSPTENEIHLGIKFYEPSSSYKKALQSMKPGDTMVAGQLAGNFKLPRDTSQKLVFVAGGIGITPFRSMLKYLIDSQQKRDVVLLYAISDPSEVAYKDIIRQATERGIKTIKILSANADVSSWNGLIGRIDSKLIKEQAPDYKDRLFYLSGPNAMVEGTKNTLVNMGVKRSSIHADYFSGY